MTLCKSCSTELSGKYCSHCGQPAHTKRIDGHYIKHEIEHVLHFEKGILFTVAELLFRPGQNVRRFLNEDRSKLVKPIIFIVITSLIYTLLSHFFHIEGSYVDFKSAQYPTITSIFNWVEGHYGYANILMGIFIAFWLKLFFRKPDYNFFEILILLCFVIGMMMLIFSLFVIFEGITKMPAMKVAGNVAIIYLVWAIGQFFDTTKASSYVKAFIAYIVGMLSFTLAAVLLAFLFDFCSTFLH